MIEIAYIWVTKNLIMKKTLLSLGAIALFATANAQAPNNLTKLETVQNIERSAYVEQSSEWYSYSNVLDLLGNMTYYRGTLFPDTTVYTLSSTENFRPFTHSVGQVIDPRSLNFAGLVGNTIAFDEHTTSTLDSISILMDYDRFAGANPDTLFVQVIKSSNSNVTMWDQSGNNAFSPSYNYMTNQINGADFTTAVLLTDADTAASSVDVEIDMVIGKDEFVAVVMAYKAGNTYSADDVLGENANRFTYFLGEDAAKTADEGFYNFSLDVYSAQRYNESTNGWNGTYYPGNIWTDGKTHTIIDAKFTTTNASTENNEGNALAVYPNPASDVLNINTNDNARVNVYAVTGELVIAENVSDSRLNIENLNAGVYMIEVITENNKLTERLVVTK